MKPNNAKMTHADFDCHCLLIVTLLNKFDGINRDLRDTTETEKQWSV